MDPTKWASSPGVGSTSPASPASPRSATCSGDSPPSPWPRQPRIPGVRLLSEPTGGVNRSGSRAGTSRKRESKPSGSLTRVDAVEPLELLPGVLIGSGEWWCP